MNDQMVALVQGLFLCAQGATLDQLDADERASLAMQEIEDVRPTDSGVHVKMTDGTTFVVTVRKSALSPRGV